jgi:TRAP-type C4-dicarboxylate transport system permease small subunit
MMKRTLEYLAGILLFFMFLTTFFQVVSRTFNISAVWSEELARLSYVWMVFLGVPVLIRESGLIRVTVLVDRIGPQTGRALRIVTELLILPFLAVITWGAWTNTVLNWKTYAPTVDWLRMGYVYLVIAVAGVAMIWYQLANLVDLMRSTFSRAERGPEGWQ